jgi:hypothetical protein
MKILFLTLTLCVLRAGPLFAGGEDGLRQAAAGVSALIAEKPAGAAEFFDRGLFRQLSAAKLEGVLAGLYKANGRVTGVVLVSSETAFSGHFLFETEKGYRLPAALSLNPETGRVNQFYFGAASKIDPALVRARLALEALPGKTALLAARLGEKPETSEALNQNLYFAAGPAFRLYVLGALLENRVPWTKVIRLKDEDKSLPAGRLQSWPDGAPFTAHTLAALMLADDDDTAADALIGAVGRRAVEAALPALGCSAPERLRPFLKTSEVRRLKADSEAALEYMNLPPEEKYGFLDALRARPLPAAPDRAGSFGPDKIGWSVSPADLCRVMGYFAAREDKPALDMLAMGTDPDLQGGKFLYAGRRVGGGPGALSMTWLLKNKRGEWHCLSAAWSSEGRSPDEAEFFGILQGAVDALAAARP